MAAKILLAVVILPFVMWGMGDVFRQGDKNIVATINNEKIPVEEFINHLNGLNLDLGEMSKKNPNFIDEALNSFISKKIIFLESSFFKINISKNSLAKIIKNEKNFLKDNNFSRTKYEKFLIKNNLNTFQFENSVKKEEELKMFFE